MTLQNVDELSDDQPCSPPAKATASTPAAGLKPDPKVNKSLKPKKGAATGNKKHEARKKDDSKAKKSEIEPKPKTKAAQPKATMKRPAASCGSDSAAKKRPSAAVVPAEEGPPKTKVKEATANKYIYHRDGVWGVKYNKVELVRVWG